MVSGDEFLKNSDVLEKMIGEAGGAGQVLLDFIPICEPSLCLFVSAQLIMVRQ